MASRVSVYIISQNTGRETFFKVGIAKDVASRLSQIQTGNPYRLEIAWEMEFSDRKAARLIEREMHQYLAEYGMSGEWFQCTYEQIVLAPPCAINIHRARFGIKNERELLERLGYRTGGTVQ